MTPQSGVGSQGGKIVVFASQNIRVMNILQVMAEKRTSSTWVLFVANLANFMHHGQMKLPVKVLRLWKFRQNDRLVLFSMKCCFTPVYMNQTTLTILFIKSDLLVNDETTSQSLESRLPQLKNTTSSKFECPLFERTLHSQKSVLSIF